MGAPRVSVIIPAYKQADYLGEAIASVLNQTFADLEVIVVNDASPDDTDQVVKQFNDPRLKYIVHAENQMLAAARNTGIRASTGEIIFLLDADDLFHPDKIKAHVEFLDAHPAIGSTYNARFGIYHSPQDTFELWRPPLTVGLSDFVMGFPFSPSDMVVRRAWLFRVDLFDASYTAFSEDLDINCRLALAGCQFASVNRALNYRRTHPARVIKNITARLDAALRALEITFTDARCPQDVLALRGAAYAAHYLVWAFRALAQNETDLGQTYLRQAAQLDPRILDGRPCELVNLFLHQCLADASDDHAVALPRLFAQLPSEMASLAEQLDWAITRGYLALATREAMWGDADQAREYFEQCVQRGDGADEAYVTQLAYQLCNYEIEFGDAATQVILRRLEPGLQKIGAKNVMRSLRGQYAINSVFQNYWNGRYARVPGHVIRAITNQPKHLANRGVWAILGRAVWQMMRGNSN